jgi:asparaginyl-tRNA synthetase
MPNLVRKLVVQKTWFNHLHVRHDHKQALRITNLLNAGDSLVNNNVQATGWIRFIRIQKENTFIHINDGSEGRNLQLVLSKKELGELYANIGTTMYFGTAVQATGKLVNSSHKQQSVELLVKDIKVIGECDPDKYPFDLKEKLDLEKLRQYPHLRSNISLFASILRFRSFLTGNLHEFFKANGFINVHTPIITQSICEGSCEAFELTTKREKFDFFSGPAYLTSSAQLHLETMVNSLGRVYTISPTFRAEPSLTRQHLSEFYMVEAELMNIDTVEDLMDFVEDLIKHVCLTVYEDCVNSDLNILKQNFKRIVDLDEHVKRTKGLGTSKFIRIKYEQAIELLNGINKTGKLPMLTFCDDLSKPHETQLIEHFDKTPVFVTHYPRGLKPFYMRVSDQNHALVDNFDLLVAGVGELVGGSAREYRYDVLMESMQMQKLNVENYKLYLETKEFGGMKMGGFGIGLERFIQFLLHIDNIRDTCAYPRYIKHCKM